MKAHECPTTKQCSACGQTKPLTEFYDPKKAQCKPCRLMKCAEYREANKTKIKKFLKEWYVRNRDHVLRRCKEYSKLPEVKERERIRLAATYAENKDAIHARRRAYYAGNHEARERFRKYQRDYAKRNKVKFNERSGRRRTARLRAFPQWADKKAILSFYKMAAEKTRDTGIKHVVDHIIPLQGKNVCGLHVEQNLQVLTEAENLRKFNKFG